MRFFCLLPLLAVASAFTTQSRSVGGFSKNVVADNTAHRNRRATIVMDGKANGESLPDDVGPIQYTRSTEYPSSRAASIHRTTNKQQRQQQSIEPNERNISRLTPFKRIDWEAAACLDDVAVVCDGCCSAAVMLQ